MSDKKGSYGWVSMVIIAGLIGGYRALTGSSLTRDAGKAITSSPDKIKQSPNSTGIATQENEIATLQESPTKGSNLTDLHEQAIGFLAQTICSTKRYDYTPEQVRLKVDYFIEAKDAESIREWMTEPKVVGAASTLAMAFNTNCTNYDPESDYTKRAFRLMDNL